MLKMFALIFLFPFIASSSELVCAELFANSRRLSLQTLVTSNEDYLAAIEKAGGYIAIAKHLPVGENLRFRGVHLSPEALQKALQIGFPAKDSPTGTMYYTAHPVIAVGYAAPRPKQAPDIALILIFDTPVLASVHPWTPYGEIYQNMGMLSRGVTREDLPLETIYAIYAFDKTAPADFPFRKIL